MDKAFLLEFVQYFLLTVEKKKITLHFDISPRKNKFDDKIILIKISIEEVKWVRRGY